MSHLSAENPFLVNLIVYNFMLSLDISLHLGNIERLLDYLVVKMKLINCIQLKHEMLMIKNNYNITFLNAGKYINYMNYTCRHTSYFTINIYEKGKALSLDCYQVAFPLLKTLSRALITDTFKVQPSSFLSCSVLSTSSLEPLRMRAAQ